jgi:hypothetical protein
MLDRIADAPGDYYEGDAYFEQFYKDCDGIDLLWKLERRQTFREADVPSWVAFEEGDVERSLQLIEEMRPDVEKYTKSKPYETKRIRVVEEPLTPYLWWEIHLLKIRADAGDGVVTLSPSAVARWEDNSPLPEFVGLGNTVLWNVDYDENGDYRGAKRIVDPALVTSCRSEFVKLFSNGSSLPEVSVESLAS